MQSRVALYQAAPIFLHVRHVLKCTWPTEAQVLSSDAGALKDEPLKIQRIMLHLV